MNSTITYCQVGDYLIPNLKLPEEEIYIGVWGMRRKNYLLQKNRILFNIMLADGSLWKHLAEVDSEAEEMFSWLVSEMAESEEVTEALKETDQIVWVGAMNNIHQKATEIINQELICC